MRYKEVGGSKFQRDNVRPAGTVSFPLTNEAFIEGHVSLRKGLIRVMVKPLFPKMLQNDKPVVLFKACCLSR